jgi:CHAT domain
MQDDRTTLVTTFAWRTKFVLSYVVLGLLSLCANFFVDDRRVFPRFLIRYQEGYALSHPYWIYLFMFLGLVSWSACALKKGLWIFSILCVMFLTLHALFYMNPTYAESGFRFVGWVMWRFTMACLVGVVPALLVTAIRLTKPFLTTLLARDRARESKRVEGHSPDTLGDKPMRILFLAANPRSTGRLDLEEELRSLEAELRGVKYRDQVVLTARHAVRPDDLVRYVRSDRPTVVHFSGHGSGGGIILRNDEGGYTEVTGTSLQRFFLNRGVRLVVLNACYTQEQAKLLPDAVSAVVGTTDSVGDVAARRFTVAFYRALGDGYSIHDAFRDGGDAVALDNKEDVFWSDGELDQLLVIPAKS